MRAKPDKLRELIHAVFVGAGCEPDEADCVASHLVESNLAGHPSHGVIRTPFYVDWLGKGMVFANRKIDVLFENECMALIDGKLGLGQSIGVQSLELGIAKCRSQGTAVLAIRNSGHLGRIGHWAELAIESGLVSLHFVSNTGLGMFVVPHGGTERRLSVNPITMGIPNPGGPPIVLDIAAAATAEGKLKVARNKGVPVPEGWILDAEGQPTTDPNKFYGPPFGAILPFGGHKGYGLGFFAEVLAGVLTGGGCSREGPTRLEQTMLSVLIDPAKLQSEQTMYEELRRYVEFVKSSKTVEADGEILVPGEIEARNRQRQLEAGIDLDETTWSQIVEVAKDHVPRELMDGVALQ